MRSEMWTRLRPWLLLIIPPLLIALIVFSFAAIVWTQTPGDAELIQDRIETNLPYLLALNHTIVFVILLLFLRLDRLSLASIGWNWTKRSLLVEIVLGLLLGIALYLFKEFVIDSVTALAQGNTPTFTSLFRFHYESAELPMLVVATCFVFIEESVYRGYAWKRLTPQLGAAGTWIVSSILFGFLHWGNGFEAIIVTAVIGAIHFGVFYWRKTLITVTIGHALYNLMVILT